MALIRACTSGIVWGKKPLGQYCCQKLFINQPELPFVLLTQSADTPRRKQNGIINMLKIRNVSM